MPDAIRDGSGKCYHAKVDANNHLHTTAVTIPEDWQGTKDGDSYNINTGEITLTNDTETPILYMKNNETRPFHVKTIILGQKPATGASTTISDVTLVKNPTAGTIVSGATNVDITSNRNFGSGNVHSSLAYKGATNLTMTGGTDHIYFYAGTGGRTVISIDEILQQGNSLGIKLLPPSSNTSLPCYVAVVGNIIDTEND